MKPLRPILRSLLFAAVTAFAAEPTAIDFYNRAVEKAEKKDFGGAIADFTSSIELDGGDADPFIGRGNARQARGDLDGAIADYDEAIKLNPKDPDVYSSRAVARTKKGQLTQAIADYDHVIGLNPKDAVALSNRASVKRSKGDFAGAIADYNEVVALNPSAAEAFNYRGVTKKSKGDLAGAIADYDEAIALNATYAVALFNRANAKNLQGDFEGALADMDKTIAAVKDDGAYPRIHRTLLLSRLHRGDPFEELLRMVPGWRKGWPTKIGQFLTGTMPETQFMADGLKDDLRVKCESLYYAGMKHVLRHETNIARDLFERCRATNARNSPEFDLAQAELDRL